MDPAEAIQRGCGNRSKLNLRPLAITMVPFAVPIRAGGRSWCPAVQTVPTALFDENRCCDFVDTRGCVCFGYRPRFERYAVGRNVAWSIMRADESAGVRLVGN
jgi:hypothetical protein